MKRISKIQIENSRAYYNKLTFNLQKGENLFLYGENGSGKTSFYKALRDFIQSFYSRVEYTQNRYKPAHAAGSISLTIGDYNSATKNIENHAEFSFSVGKDNTNVSDTAYIKALALSKGFLNYRDLLKVYLYEDSNPNLFDFFVLNLLKNHIPLAQGWTNSLETEWEKLNKELFNVYNRKEVKHRRGLKSLENFEIVLRATLTSLFDNVNTYLTKYFPNFSLITEYHLEPMSFKYGYNKSKWGITKDLRLSIKLDNSNISEYTENLNEARLSSIAICLYLAALHANHGGDMRLMFLDDIFIGIDSVNRLPILKLLNEEFSDFQIIITTYDRSWYYMARNHIDCYASEKWKFFNLFSLPHNEGGKTFMVPIVSEGNSSYDRAKGYLHGHRDIDLPAAANYFRKTLEELFSEKHLPKELFLNEDYTIIPGFKLSKRVDAVVNLFNKIGEETKYIYTIKSYLHTLIHPLSHYNEEAQVYRTELIEIEKAIDFLSSQFKRVLNKCQILIGKGNTLIIHYNVADGSYKSKYHVIFEENIWIYKDITGVPKITDSKCRTIYMEGEENGESLKSYHPQKTMSQFNYSSLDDAIQKIYEHEKNVLHHAVVAHTDYNIVHRQINNEQTECIVVRRDTLLAQMP